MLFVAIVGFGTQIVEIFDFILLSLLRGEIIPVISVEILRFFCFADSAQQFVEDMEVLLIFGPTDDPRFLE